MDNNTNSRPNFNVQEISPTISSEGGGEEVKEGGMVTPPINTIPQNPYPMPNIQLKGKPKVVNKFLFLIPALILIITIVLTGLILQRSMQSKIQVLPTPSPTPTLIPATPIPTLKPVIKNKTYTNTSLKISFLYPEIYSLFECKDKIVFIKMDENLEQDSACDQSFNSPVTLSNSQKSFTLVKNPTNEEVGQIGGEEPLVQTDDSGTTYLTFKKDKIQFRLIYPNIEFKDLSGKIIESFRFVEIISDDWQVFEDETLGIQFKYPPNWSLIEDVESGKIILKNNENNNVNLTIDVTKNVANIGITASSTISSTKSLSGWVKEPSMDTRNISGGTAQLLQGTFNDTWQIVTALWKKSTLVELLWIDEIDQINSQTFENIMSTFEFLD